MDHSLQPVYTALKVILDCLKVGKVYGYGMPKTWLFTLCYVYMEEEFGNVPWPNLEPNEGVLPEFYRQFRARTVKYYIDYVDALLTESELPLTEHRRWRWHSVRAVPKEGFQTTILQILAEYLLQDLVVADDSQDQEETRKLLDSWARKVQHPALRMIIHAYETRTYEDLPPDMDDRWKSEAWLYAATFSYGLRGKSFRPGDEPLLHFSAARIIEAILQANKPSLNSMLDELLTKKTRLMVRTQLIMTNLTSLESQTADHWIGVIVAFSRQNKQEEVERFATQMVCP